MSKRNQIIIGIIVLILILLSLYYIFGSRNPQEAEQPINTQIQEQINQNQDLIIDKPEGTFIDSSSQVQQNVNVTSQEVTLQQQQASVKAMALSFVERMGSFSNQSNYANIEELKPFMTNQMKAWADSYVAEQRAAQSDISNYYGVSTKVISMEVTNFDDNEGRADIKTNTQRLESVGAQRNTVVRYQEASITLIKDVDVWYVDSFSWL